MTKNSKVSIEHAALPDDLRIYAIGDVHGCKNELEKLLYEIEVDLKSDPVSDHRIIFIGDYVDRGPDSKGVVDLLIRLQNSSSQNCIFLRGNHEEKLINALIKLDKKSWAGFTKYGGIETLSSYAFDSVFLKNMLVKPLGKSELVSFSEHMRKVIGAEHIAFLKSLQSHVCFGDYFFCHAGVDPERTFDQQTAHDLAWMREPFLSWSRPLAKVVVHGHTPKKTVEFLQHRINVDTACVYGNTLTALVLQDTSKRLLQIESNFTFTKE